MLVNQSRERKKTAFEATLTITRSWMMALGGIRGTPEIRLMRCSTRAAAGTTVHAGEDKSKDPHSAL